MARHYDTTHKDAALGLEDPDSVPWTEHLRRREQDRIDRMVKGEEVGHYYVLLGPKVCFIRLVFPYTNQDI